MGFNNTEIKYIDSNMGVLTYKAMANHLKVDYKLFVSRVKRLQEKGFLATQTDRVKRKDCEWCGKAMEAPKGVSMTSFCSVECREMAMKSREILQNGHVFIKPGLEISITDKRIPFEEERLLDYKLDVLLDETVKLTAFTGASKDEETARRVAKSKGKFVAEYPEFFLFKKHNGLKECFLKKDIAAGNVIVEYVRFPGRAVK